jgi:dGTPase
MDRAHFEALAKAKRDNYALIYEDAAVRERLDAEIRPMMAELYERLLDDALRRNVDSPLFRHHVAYVQSASAHYARTIPYEETEPNQLVVDYVASMTDDYFIDLHRHLFPDSPHRIDYRGYFDETQF